MQITGTIVRLFQAQQITEKFKSRKVWVRESVEHYPNTFEVEFTNDNCSKLDAFTEGQKVTIDINIRGRYWQKNDREGVMTSLNGWRIAVDESTPEQDVPTSDVDEMLF